MVDRSKKIIIGILILFSISIVCVFCFMKSVKNYSGIGAENFYKVLSGNYYEVIDKTNVVDKYSIDNFQVATNDKRSIAIYYYSFVDERTAITAFGDTSLKLKSDKNSLNANKTLENYQRIESTTNDAFKVVVRYKNTIISIDGPKIEKSYIIKVVKGLGY